MYRVQGTLREWVTRDEVRRFIAKKFKEFLLTYVNPKSEHGDFEYLRQINEMVSGKNTMLITCQKSLVAKFADLSRLNLAFKSSTEIFYHFSSSLNCSIFYIQLTSVASRLITNNSYMSIPILPSGWQMHLSPSLK